MATNDNGYDITYREALRAIADQQSALDALQTRGGIVASAAAIVLGLVGQRALTTGPLSLPLVLALVDYLLLALAISYVLWPKRRWRFHFGVPRLHTLYIESAVPLSADLMKRDLALHLDQYFGSNAQTLDRLAWALSTAIICLLVEGSLLIYDLVEG
jgi:hypothetical protein